MSILSSQKTINNAGSAEALGSLRIDGPLMIKALDTNTGTVAVGNNGSNSVSLSSGLRLASGDAIVFEFVGSLDSLFLDAAVDNEGVSWICLNI